MSLLTIIQDALSETGLSTASEITVVTTSADATVLQALALANRSGKFLAQRFGWQELMKEFTHTTVATESQGLVETIMPGFNWDLYQTMWNRTNTVPVGGPLFPDEWQLRKAVSFTGPFPQFRIRGKYLLMNPVPSAGDTVAGEYMSRYWCQSSGGTGQEEWAADTDTGILSEDLLTADLKWRMLRAKGMDYSEEKMEAEMLINNAMSRSGSNRTLNLEGCDAYADRNHLGGVLIPEASW